MTTTAAMTSKIADARSATPTSFPLIRILLVEDNPEHAEWAKMLLTEGLGDACDVTWAQDLSGAIAAFENANPPDVVVLDLGLPDLSGYKCQLVMHMIAPAVPVVVLSADDRQLTKELTSLGGSRAFLVKGETTAGVLASTIMSALVD